MYMYIVSIYIHLHVYICILHVLYNVQYIIDFMYL